MTQYKTQYGTVFAVKEHNGSPAIMCRAEVSETWSLSSMITPFTPGAWTAEELQGQLDNWAATKGWQPVAKPASACLCETCTCTGCHEDCFGHCKGCGHPVDHCNSYQTEGEKRLRAEPASAEPPEIVDECSVEEDGFPGWVRPMVEAFLQFDFVRELPAFTTAAFKNSEPVRHHWGGSLANGLYDTGPKGIKFFVFRGDSSDQYREVSYTWADFVRRCKAAGLAPEPHQDKEDAPCNTEPTAPTGDAAATTDGSAAVSTAGTTTISASGAGANSCGTPAPAAQPSNEPPAGLAPTAPMSLPAFDYSGLDVPTRDALHWAEKEIGEARRDYIARLAQAVAIAHDALCATVVQNLDNGKFTKSEESFQRWCESVGIKRSTAYNLLQVQALLSGSTPEEQATLEAASPSLLYAAAKPSAPAELVQAVKDGDITSHKQYQEALAEIRARDAKITDLLDMSEAADRRADKAEQAAKDTARERDAALRRAAEAENRAAGAQKLAEQRGTENTELKAKIRELENQPRDVAVVQPGEEQIEAWRREGADRMAATMRETVRKANDERLKAQNRVTYLQEQLAAARPDADACQRTVDTLYETTENLRLLLRTQLRQAQLTPADYGNVVAHVLLVANALRDTVRNCAPAGYTMDDDEEDFL